MRAIVAGFALCATASLIAPGMAFGSSIDVGVSGSKLTMKMHEWVPGTPNAYSLGVGVGRRDDGALRVVPHDGFATLQDDLTLKLGKGCQPDTDPSYPGAAICRGAIKKLSVRLDCALETMFWNLTDLPSKANGYSGFCAPSFSPSSNFMLGGSAEDVLKGGKDFDNYIDGRGGNDRIRGGNQHNNLYGGQGADVIVGGNSDTIHTNDSENTPDGAVDKVTCRSGLNDRVFAEAIDIVSPDCESVF